MYINHSTKTARGIWLAIQTANQGSYHLINRAETHTNIHGYSIIMVVFKKIWYQILVTYIIPYIEKGHFML